MNPAICSTTRIERLQIPLVAQLRRDFVQKPGRLLRGVTDSSLREANQRIAQVKLAFRPRNRDVKEPSFLFLALERAQRTRCRKQSVAEHDDEDDCELESLGLVDSRKPDLFGVRRSRPVVFRLEIREQRQLCEKFF